MMANRLFEITLGDGEPYQVLAASRAKARAEAFSRAADAWNITFREFLQIVKVRSVPLPTLPPRDPRMNDAWRELARHALGLPNDRLRTYRNRFVAGEGGADHAAWMGMVDAGFAKRRKASTLPFGGNDLFWLTRSGADAALDPGERLDPEDWPKVL